MRLPEFDRPSRLPPNPYVITHDLFLSPACAGLVAVSPTTHVVAAFWNRRCLARCRRRLGCAYRAQTRGGSLLHHVPNRPPRFPTSAPPPGPSAHPSGFSIRSQQGSIGFNPTAFKAPVRTSVATEFNSGEQIYCLIFAPGAQGRAPTFWKTLRHVLFCARGQMPAAGHVPWQHVKVFVRQRELDYGLDSLEFLWRSANGKSLYGLVAGSQPQVICRRIHCRRSPTRVNSRPGLDMCLFDIMYESSPLTPFKGKIQPHPVKPAGFPAHGVMQSTLEPKPPRIEIDPHLNHHLIWHAAFVVIERVDFLAVFKHKRIAVGASTHRQQNQSQRTVFHYRQYPFLPLTRSPRQNLTMLYSFAQISERHVAVVGFWRQAVRIRRLWEKYRNQQGQTDDSAANLTLLTPC